VKTGGRDELIMSYPNDLRAYDPQSGRLLWKCDGLNPLIYTSPIFGDGVAVGMGGFLGTTIAARTGGTGDVTATHRLWQSVRTANRLGAGLVHHGHIYILNTPGIAECLDLKTSSVIWSERLPGIGAKKESWSALVRAGDRLYALNQSGDTIIFRAAPKFEVLAVNSIGSELTNASHAVADGEVFLRTHAHLWCIGEQK
jgi:outer membrane protein assembly factor BamB